MSTIAVIGLLASLAGQLYSSHQSSEEQKKADSMLRSRIGDLEGALDVETARSIFDTEDAQQALERLRSGLQQITRQQEQDAIRTGLTQEGQLAAADVAGQRYAGGLSDLSVLGDRNRRMEQHRYQNMLQGLYQQQMGRQDQRTAQWDQQGQNWAQMGGIATELAGLYATPTQGTTPQTGGFNQTGGLNLQPRTNNELWNM